MIDAFSSHVYMCEDGDSLHCCGVKCDDSGLHAEDGSLPQGLTIQNAYTEMCNGSKNVAIVVRNSMAYPQAVRKKTSMARAVAAIWVSETTDMDWCAKGIR